MLDVNGFKAVNDTLGHAAGDRVVVEVARCLTCAVRGRAVLYRWRTREELSEDDGGGREGEADHGEFQRRAEQSGASEDEQQGETCDDGRQDNGLVQEVSSRVLPEKSWRAGRR